MVVQSSRFEVHSPQYSPSSESMNVRIESFGPVDMSSRASRPLGVPCVGGVRTELENWCVRNGTITGIWRYDVNMSRLQSIKGNSVVPAFEVLAIAFDYFI